MGVYESSDSDEDSIRKRKRTRAASGKNLFLLFHLKLRLFVHFIFKFSLIYQNSLHPIKIPKTHEHRPGFVFFKNPQIAENRTQKPPLFMRIFYTLYFLTFTRKLSKIILIGVPISAIIFSGLYMDGMNLIISTP